MKCYNLTFHFSALDDSGITYSQIAYASVQWQAAESGDLTRRFLSLQSVLIGLDSPPTISAETFPVHLGMPSLVAHTFRSAGSGRRATATRRIAFCTMATRVSQSRVPGAGAGTGHVRSRRRWPRVAPARPPRSRGRVTAPTVRGA